MQSETEYKDLLNRLRESLPETITAQSRFKKVKPPYFEISAILQMQSIVNHRIYWLIYCER